MKKITILSLLCLLLFAACDKVNIRPQADFTDQSYGCVDFLVYKFNDKHTELLKITGDRTSLGLGLAQKSFDLADQSDNLEAWIEVYDSSAFQTYCNDVAGSTPELISDWEGYEGNVNISIIEDSIMQNPAGGYSYRVNVLLEEGRFRNVKGKTVRLQSAFFENVYVGWLPG
ncbi:MAG: hypothetical protein H6581_15270 [Bacteroidia bacterium]|nr:hypothetical protein [Bacteroidia bacterium]